MVRLQLFTLITLGSSSVLGKNWKSKSKKVDDDPQGNYFQEWIPKPNMGLVATLANGKEVPVPQMGMDVDVKVTGNVASSEITINYRSVSQIL